jgi:hypothetical protein
MIGSGAVSGGVSSIYSSNMKNSITNIALTSIGLGGVFIPLKI